MTRTTQGTGLGLFLVKQIVTGHHGTVTVLRTGPKGTTFQITLPDALWWRSDMKKHILIVEDEEHLAEALAHNLQFEGYNHDDCF